MFRSLSNLFSFLAGNSRKASPAGRRIRLDVEALEDRLVPSASSANIHAIAQPNSTSVAYFINPVNGAFYEKIDYAGYGFIQQVARAGAISAFSAGLTNAGTAVVFANYYGALEYFTDATGWQSTPDTPIDALNFAAVNGGRLYAVAANHALWEFTIPYQVTVPMFNVHTHQIGHRTMTCGGWSELTTQNQVYSVDAVTQTSGGDAVFTQGYNTINNSGNCQLKVYSQGAWTNIPTNGLVGSGVITQLCFSAGLDSHGNAELWYQMSANSSYYGFYSWTAAAGVQTYLSLNSSPKYMPILSATGGGQCYFFQPDYDNPNATSLSGALKVYDPQTTDTLVMLALQRNTQISAAGAGDVYYIDGDNLVEVSVAANYQATTSTVGLWQL
jgi:hypothetical protein